MRVVCDFVEKVKLYKQIQEELGITNNASIHINAEKIKKLSRFFSTKVKLEYYSNAHTEYKYFYHLCIDGIDFVAVSNLEKILDLGLTEDDFKKGAKVWG